MSFRPSIKSVRSNIRPIAPLIYAATQGLVADLWMVEAHAGARGQYIARDPCFVIVLGSEPSPVSLHDRPDEEAQTVRAVYIPGSVPITSLIAGPTKFEHLDLHFNPRYLASCLTEMGEPSHLLDQPVYLTEDSGVLAIAETLAEDIRRGTAGTVLLDCLALGIVAKMLASRTSVQSDEPLRGGLTQDQLTQVDRLMRTEMHRRLPVSEMAERAGLSESWFAHAYRKTRGDTPHRALQAIRVDTAQRLLEENRYSIADVAVMVGFADQAHLTRAFRTVTGETPGQWRKKSISEQDRIISDSFSQYSVE